MYRLLAVVLILLGVYLVARVLFPIRERLEPTDQIKPPTVRIDEFNMSYSKEEVERIWRMVPNPDDVAAIWSRNGVDDVEQTKIALASFVAAFYDDVYKRSQTPITKEQTRAYAKNYIEQADMINVVSSLLEAYFIDQVPPTASAAGTSAATPAPPAMGVSAATPDPAMEVSAAMPAPAMGGSVKSGPAPIDVTGRATITINVN